jgi:beta-lactamase superfamily II metal-dependent hydrolase
MNLRRVVRAARLLLCALVAAAASARAQDSTAVRLVFFDVGQGDAALVISPEGKVALIDAGPAEAGLAGRLRRLEIDTIDLVVASHAHADHIGGMEAVLRTLPVRAFLDNGMPYTTATYRRLMGAVASLGITYLAPVARTIALGSVPLRVLPPWPRATSQNDGSVGIALEFGAFRALFVGDAERYELSYFLTLGVPPVTVLKAAHHGAWNGLTPDWITRTHPRVVVISAGGGNPYGHPDPRALYYYSTVGASIYRTDRDGTIEIRGHADGSYEVETQHARQETVR